MKNIFILAGLIAVMPQLSPAASCGSGTLSSYVGLGASGCTLGSETLSGFQVLAGTAGASEIAASNVLLSPVLSATSPGLTTTVSVMSAANTVQESLFTYQISGGPLTSAFITLSNASETADGAVTGLLNFCAGGSFGANGVSGCTGLPGALATVDGAQNQDSALFATTGLVSVTNDLTIDGGLAGSATGATLVDQFTAAPSTATPEPMSFVLTGSGLAFLVVVRRRFTNIGSVRR